ncbi:MAG: hydratase [Treponema sp.]|jgi:aconitate hydratase|nr:hydratase [Treponema sp.]
MITVHTGPVYLIDGVPKTQGAPLSGEPPGKGTIAYRVLDAHNRSTQEGSYHIRFDQLISHDITYVGIIQSARSSGLKQFSLPYGLTNCHNSLCAVGGTINEDDHVFGLSAARKYGGIYVPANLAVLHQYAREMMGLAGGMILGSDSHTRYGPLGVMGIGEGGPELVKQLLSHTYDIPAPEVVLVYLSNAPKPGVGPHDVALALCAAVYEQGLVKNSILEFVGPGIASLPMDFRLGLDVMTTETGCLSSIWQTDEAVKDYYCRHGRESAYSPLAPAQGAVYHRMICIDLAQIEPMIAIPFHPSKAYTIRELNAHAGDILRSLEQDAQAQCGVPLTLTDKVSRGRLVTDQGIIAGCAGGLYDNIREAAALLSGASLGDGDFSLSIYPASMPLALQLMEAGIQQALIEAGALFKPCFCGPCFGAGDVPAHNSFSIRHTTRNFPNREGSRPGDGQLALVALMDARSIAATARNQGLLTAATELAYTGKEGKRPPFNGDIYAKRVYQGFGKPETERPLRYGPNIRDWPKIEPLGEHLLLRLASVIHDPVTTTDELIPSGETSSYRSNPQKLASFTLSRRDPQYVKRAQEIRALETRRQQGEIPSEVAAVLESLGDRLPREGLHIGSVIFARKPGDGSAREQAASCQRVLGGLANIAYEYATKRYRSNLINWGMLPFTLEEVGDFTGEPGDWILVPRVREHLKAREEGFPAKLWKPRQEGGPGVCIALTLRIGELSPDEGDILCSGCLMNYYAAEAKEPCYG